jgi:hypothetical protein
MLAETSGRVRQNGTHTHTGGTGRHRHCWAQDTTVHAAAEAAGRSDSQESLPGIPSGRPYNVGHGGQVFITIHHFETCGRGGQVVVRRTAPVSRYPGSNPSTCPRVACSVVPMHMCACVSARCATFSFRLFVNKRSRMPTFS